MAEKKGGNTVQRIIELVKPIADNLGVDIWDVRFEKEGASWFLRVFIDKDEGITIEDCENLTRPLNDVLDEVDPIEQSYVLEVGSPGLGRDLVKEQHFLKYLGEEVRIKFYKAIDGNKELVCILKDYCKDFITVLFNGDTREIKHSEYSYVKLYDDKDLF